MEKMYLVSVWSMIGLFRMVQVDLVEICLNVMEKDKIVLPGLSKIKIWIIFTVMICRGMASTNVLIKYTDQAGTK